MALPIDNINTTIVRNEIGASTNDVSELVKHANVNRWGLNPPDATQFNKYYGVANYNLDAPFELGAFRRYEHRYRAYTWDKVQKHVQDYYVGLVVFTKIANASIGDDAAVSDTIVRLTFEYKNQSGNFVSGGYVTANINKVGSALIRSYALAFANILATQVRISLTSDTPLASRYFDSRKVPTTEAQYYTHDFNLFEHLGNNQWLIGYNFFANLFYHDPPQGVPVDFDGFYSMQSYAYANWRNNSADIGIHSIATTNLSPFAFNLTFKLKCSSSMFFTEFDEYTMYNQPYSILRGWTESGQTNTWGIQESNEILFQNIAQYGSITYCQLIVSISGGNSQYVSLGDTNLLQIKFKMINR